MSNSPFSINDIPDQSGKTILITGANSGLGFESTLALAGKGARVIMACRDHSKGEAARQKILARLPAAELELLQLDLASLASVRLFARSSSFLAQVQGA